MENSFIPRKDSDLNSFEGNYKTKLALHAASLELDPAEVTDTTQIIDANMNAYDIMVSKRAEAKSAAAEYKITRKTAELELRRMSKKIKASKKYNLSKGQDLQIISPKPGEIEPSEKQPILKAKVNGHIVDIRFNKGKSNVINIYSRRGDETGFRFLAINTEVHFLDERDNLESGKPEHREYYAYFIEKNAEIGQRSDTVKVVVP